ncbi:MAG: nitroreductase [Syntrophales bacterium]|jgi:nitroreductase
MEIVEAIRARKSIRAFKPVPIKKEIVKEILQIATRAPSGTNTQPWEFVVLAGEILEKVRQANVEHLKSGTPPNPEISFAISNPDTVYQKRRVEITKQLFQLMEIPRGDTEKRMQWLERGFRFFDAPVAIIISVDRLLSEEGPLMDIGAVMQTICLTALNYSLGSCIEYQGVMYPGVLRKYACIPESKRILAAIALGFPDWDFPANNFQSTRELVDNITNWCGFE